MGPEQSTRLRAQELKSGKHRAGALTFRQSFGIVMGANIGTTFSSQLIALDIDQSPIPIFPGIVFSFVAKNEKVFKVARVVLFFGILFFGLYTMERAVEPLKDHKQFLSWMEKLDTPLHGTLIRAIETAQFTGISRFVFTSTTAIFEYLITKNIHSVIIYGLYILAVYGLF